MESLIGATYSLQTFYDRSIWIIKRLFFFFHRINLILIFFHTCEETLHLLNVSFRFFIQVCKLRRIKRKDWHLETKTTYHCIWYWGIKFNFITWIIRKRVYYFINQKLNLFNFCFFGTGSISSFFYSKNYQGRKVNDPVIVILLLKFDKVLKNNFNRSILQQLIVGLSNMDYKKLSKLMIIQ